MVKIGINGFGRVGRAVMRACIDKGLQVKAVNDPFVNADYMAYLLKYDSTHGRSDFEIETLNQTVLLINGATVVTYQERDPKLIPWGMHHVEYVIDATGVFASYDQATLHLVGGARKVLLTSPSATLDVPMLVMGVNHSAYRPEMVVVSCASATTNSLAPLLHVIHAHFRIVEGLLTTVHAIRPTQKVLDGPAAGGQWRNGRGAFQNIIPTATEADKAIGRVMPELEGKIRGIAIGVPVVNVSLLDITLRLGTSATYESIKAKVHEAADGALHGILGYTEEDLTSSDFIGDSRSCIFDAKAGLPLSNQFVKLIAWYDNEYGFACRIADLVYYMAAKDKEVDDCHGLVAQQ